MHKLIQQIFVIKYQNAPGPILTSIIICILCKVLILFSLLRLFCITAIVLYLSEHILHSCKNVYSSPSEY